MGTKIVELLGASYRHEAKQLLDALTDWESKDSVLGGFRQAEGRLSEYWLGYLIQHIFPKLAQLDADWLIACLESRLRQISEWEYEGNPSFAPPAFIPSPGYREPIENAGGERARRVHSLLLGPESAFVLVSGPAPESVAHAGTFLDHLDSTRAPLAGVVVNRVRLWPLGAPAPRPSEWGDAEREALAMALGAGAEHDFPAADAARAAIDATASYASIVERDAQATAPLLRRVERAGGFGLRVPELSEDVHDLRGLARIGELLLGPQS